MRFLFRANIYGWRMTGFIGKKAKWFLGFSRNVSAKKQAIERHIEETWSFPYQCPFCETEIEAPSDNMNHGIGKCVSLNDGEPTDGHV